MKQPKILIIAPHMDDEVLFGWPIIQNTCLSYSILYCTISKRLDSALNLAAWLHHSFDYLHYENPLYKNLDGKKGEFQHFLEDLFHVINCSDYDLLYIPNPWGEYGHIDHIYLHNILYNEYRDRCFWSNIRINAGWLPDIEIKLNKNVDYIHRKEIFYNEMLNFYDKPFSTPIPGVTFLTYG
jgi:LmbE family N-acetylglucosaminyl deacetylase